MDKREPYTLLAGEHCMLFVCLILSFVDKQSHLCVYDRKVEVKLSRGLMREKRGYKRNYAHRKYVHVEKEQ